MSELETPRHVYAVHGKVHAASEMLEKAHATSDEAV